MWAFVALIAFLVFFASLIGLLLKSTRNTAKRLAPVSALVMLFAASLAEKPQEGQANSEGNLARETHAEIQSDTDQSRAVPSASGGGNPSAVGTDASSAPAADKPTYAGRVLPFTVIRAIRNFGYKDGMVGAQISVFVNGGTQADWMATAKFLAKKAIVNKVTFSEVGIYAPNPWGDSSPIRVKNLAKAYFGGPDPKKSPWPDDPASVSAEDHAPSLPDIEFLELSNDLTEKLSSKIKDPEKLSDKADEQARKMLIKKYGLPAKWKPDETAGRSGNIVKFDQIQIVSADNTEKSIAELSKCLDHDEGESVRGCNSETKSYVFSPVAESNYQTPILVMTKNKPLIWSGSIVYAISNTIACPKVEDVDRLDALIRENDTVAAARYASMSSCLRIEKNQTGKVESTSVWSDAACVRFRGYPMCLWTEKLFLGKIGGDE
jgi:hypothetical protein